MGQILGMLFGLGVVIYLARNLRKVNVAVTKAYTCPDHSNDRVIR